MEIKKTILLFKCTNRLTNLVNIIKKLSVKCLVLTAILMSCETDTYELHRFNEEINTIGGFLKENKEQYSKFYQLLEEGKLLTTLGGYNPEAEGYTLFLPTDSAFDEYVKQNENYESFEEMLQDTIFAKQISRYHTVNKKYRSNDFPDGALVDKTLSGDRLVTVFYAVNDNQLIRVNNTALIVNANLEMSNGYIHVISEVLQKADVSGYDWLLQQDEFSILAQAMEYCRIRNRLWFNKYTILAEHDSVYHREGIYNVDDLMNRIASPNAPSSIKFNALYDYTAYHILNGEYFLNDLNWGNHGYWTLSGTPVTIDVGLELRINPGVNNYKMVNESGDTITINYVRPVWEECNYVTKTGPVHSISDLLSIEPLP